MITQTKAKYKLKWNVPLCDVEVVEYGTGVNVLANSCRTTITRSPEGTSTKNIYMCLLRNWPLPKRVWKLGRNQQRKGTWDRLEGEDKEKCRGIFA